MLNQETILVPAADRNIRYRKLTRWAERGALFLLVVFLAFHIMPRAWKSLVTDFPNYYMSARLAHEGYDTSRMYEWKWLQREKDHRAVGVRVIGLVPITPFSTLAMWPLARLAPLTAKHIWIILSLLLLIPISWMLRSMTGLSYERIALIFALSFPLYRNLEFGQFYVLLLLLIVAACWSWLRGFWALAGTFVAVAAACKIFPVLLFIFFLRRKAWRSVAWGSASGAAAATISVAVFGWNVHRTYLFEILPWNLHGDVMQPYAVSGSISGILHSLLLSEPQWNPNPWHFSPLCYALLLPSLQMLVLAPAILLIRRGSATRECILLEWSALLTAALAISTVPASYNFVLMALPVCVLAALLLQRRSYGWLAALAIAYVGMGFPVSRPSAVTGLMILLYVPRLFLMLAVLAGIYWLLWHDSPAKTSVRDRSRYAWAAALLLFVALNAHSTFFRERDMRREYAYRLPLLHQGYLNADPQSAAAGVRYIAFTLGGYQLVTSGNYGSPTKPDPPIDTLSFSGSPGHLWVEESGNSQSKIVDFGNPRGPVIEDARDPLLSADGRSLAFVRDHRGRGRLMMDPVEQSGAMAEIALTPPSLNVYEASFLSAKKYAFSAVEGRHPPQIYLTDAMHKNAPLALGESRYPALSPDGRWMAYSHFERGAWNLWLRDETTGATRRIGNVPCNEIQPAWETDSKTLLYSTDCGRSLWWTAIARRKVVP